MGYLFLSFSVLSGAVKGFFGKKVGDGTPSIKSAVFSNLIRMLFCIAFGFVFVLIDAGVGALAVSLPVLLLSAIAAASTCVFIISWLLAVRNSAYMSVDAFISFGVLVPIIFSFFLYGEQVKTSQLIGLLLLFASVIAMSVYSNQIKNKLSIGALLLLLTVGISNGVTDFSQKVFVNAFEGVPASVFNFYIYLFSAIILTVLFFILPKSKDSSDTSALSDKRRIIYIAIMAFALFLCSYFKTLAAKTLGAVELYPLSQGSALILSLLMSVFFFKEKMKPISAIGISILFVGLLFINVFSF